MQTEDKIRAWIHGQPGLVISYSPQAVMAEALKLFTETTGVACALGAFTDALWRAGYRPEQVGAHWQLALPTKQHASDSHFRRLRHITG